MFKTFHYSLRRVREAVHSNYRMLPSEYFGAIFTRTILNISLATPAVVRTQIDPIWSNPWREFRGDLLSRTLKYSLLVVGFIMLTAPGFAHAQSISEEGILVDKARLTLESFLAAPDMEWFRDHMKDARGLLIIPQFIKGAFFIGGSMGNGVLVIRDEKTHKWSYPAFFTLGGVSFGFQFGGQASEVILLIMTQKGIDSMMSTTLKLGADAAIAVGPIGRGIEGSTALNLSTDLLSFSKAKGLFAGVSLEGAAVATREARNTSYYNTPTTTTDILVRRNVNNPQAEPLLTVVRRATKVQ